MLRIELKTKYKLDYYTYMYMQYILLLILKGFALFMSQMQIDGLLPNL